MSAGWRVTWIEPAPFSSGATSIPGLVEHRQDLVTRIVDRAPLPSPVIRPLVEFDRSPGRERVLPARRTLASAPVRVTPSLVVSLTPPLKSAWVRPWSGGLNRLASADFDRDGPAVLVQERDVHASAELRATVRICELAAELQRERRSCRARSARSDPALRVFDAGPDGSCRSGRRRLRDALPPAAERRRDHDGERSPRTGLSPAADV